MTRTVATTTGLYPLPDAAKRDLADLKGHQKDDLITGDEGSEVTEAYERVRETLITEQIDAGVDLIVEGQARWDDMLAHPLTVHDNVDTGGIVRYYDNNNFYRRPRVVGDLNPSGDVPAEVTAAAEHCPGEPGDQLQAVLPGPYTLSDLGVNDHYDDEVAFIEAVGDFLAAEVSEFPPHRTLWLLEPSFVVDPPEEGIDERVSAAVDRIASATQADVVVHTYWGAVAEKPYAHLLDADIDAVGFDFVAADRESNLYCINEYGATDDIAVGVVDGQNTQVETPETVADRVEWIQAETPGATYETLYVTQNTESFYLPTNKHRAKLEALAAGADHAGSGSEDPGPETSEVQV